MNCSNWSTHTRTLPLLLLLLLPLPLRAGRHAGVTWCSESCVLIDRLDHYCPWSGTTIGRHNMGAFELFVFMVQHHVALFFVVAVVGYAMQFDPDIFPHIYSWVNTTVVPLLPEVVTDHIPAFMHLAPPAAPPAGAAAVLL
jgi:hypothetical protein